MMNLFRTLRADEIDCRVATVKDSGVSLLLYKDARCDQNILDETVGPMNWQRQHSRDNRNCTVLLWDESKAQWIGKEDVGTPSNTEADKGLASDSFKRACFNWGIGRELYSAPFIWIPGDKCTISERNGKAACYDHFTVTEIAYKPDGARDICKLTVRNDKTGKAVFSWEDKEARPAQPETEPPETIAEPKAPPKKSATVSGPTNFQIAMEWCNTVGITLDSFKNYVQAAIKNGAAPNKKVNDMTDDEFNNVLKWVNANAS